MKEEEIPMKTLRNIALLLAGLVALSVLANIATAAPLTFMIEWPTQHEDGTSIPTTGPGKLTSARIEWGTCTGADTDILGQVQGQVTIVYPATSITTEVGSGIKCARGYANTDLNVESGVSNLGRYYPAPSPLVLSAGARPVYELRKKSDGDYQFVNVGTVPVGTRCGLKLVGEYAAINGARITKPLKGGVIAAKCL